MKLQRRFLAIFTLFIGMSGCNTSTVPQRRELLGSWVSTSIAGVGIRMTVVETARSVEGAGAWAEGTRDRAFGVSGALAGSEVGLLFHFEDDADLSFLGYFSDSDRLEGKLSGSGMSGVSLTFERDNLAPK